MTAGHHWDGYTHRMLYDMIHGTPPGGLHAVIAELTGQELEPGAGVSGAEGALLGWGRFTALMEAAKAETEAALADAGASWEGLGADSTRAGISPLAQWAADAKAACAATQSSVDDHLRSFALARARMPEPVPPDPSGGGVPTSFPRLFGGQSDQEARDVAAREAKAEAVRVMTGYEGHATVARSSLGTFVPPPSVTVEVPAPPLSPPRITSVGAAVTGPARGSRAATGAGGTTTPGGTAAGAPDSPHGTVPSAPAATVPGSSGGTPSRAAKPVGGPESPGGRGQVAPAVTGAPPVTAGGSHVAARGNDSGRGGGSAGGFGRNPGGFRDTAGDRRVPGRGAPPGTTALSGLSTGGRGEAGSGARTGAGPMGVLGRPPEEEDKEHQAPAYLWGTNDAFWDDVPDLPPPVFGADD